MCKQLTFVYVFSEVESNDKVINACTALQYTYEKSL